MDGTRDGRLFQSEEWARFQEISGHKPVPFTSENFQGFAFVEKLPIFGNYLYIPRGPKVEKNQGSELKNILEKLAHEERAGWIRVEPQTEEELEILKEVFPKVIPAPKDIQPREILVIPLLGAETEWLARMKSKTRYNIRLAEKHGVMVRFSRAEKDLESFLKLIDSTTNRQAIRPHPRAYYRNFLSAFPEAMCTLAIAEKDGQVLASALLVFFGETAYYLHGGSSDEKRELMAPFLLHFVSMREAKRRDMHKYDMGGVKVKSVISNQKAKNNDWEGITRFKLGFHPTQETLLFPGTYDIVLKRGRYFLYNTVRKLRSFLPR